MRWKLEHILKKRGGSILYDDEAIVCINKPAGFLVLPDRFDFGRPNLSSLLNEVYGPIFVVHRIDKDTSGLIVFAKTAQAHASLSGAFERREVQKSYRAIVRGNPTSDSGTIDLPIIENPSGTMSIARAGGKESRTEYTVLERFHGYAFLALQPRTGRTHQIRIHLKAMRLPILGDSIYGNGDGFYLSSIKSNYRLKTPEEKPLLKRTALHACSLSFLHPTTKEGIRLQVQLPKDMDAVLKSLRKYRFATQPQRIENAN
jgi:23S rRNA pseudouridine1911/1915/1917 synthase